MLDLILGGRMPGVELRALFLPAGAVPLRCVSGLVKLWFACLVLCAEPDGSCLELPLFGVIPPLPILAPAGISFYK